MWCWSCVAVTTVKVDAWVRCILWILVDVGALRVHSNCNLGLEIHSVQVQVYKNAVYIDYQLVMIRVICGWLLVAFVSA